MDKKIPLIPHSGRKACFRGTTQFHAKIARTHDPDNGGRSGSVSRTAPGRTKRHAPGRLSAGDQPSLGDVASAIFPFIADNN